MAVYLCPRKRKHKLSVNQLLDYLMFLPKGEDLYNHISMNKVTLNNNVVFVSRSNNINKMRQETNSTKLIKWQQTEIEPAIKVKKVFLLNDFIVLKCYIFFAKI